MSDLYINLTSKPDIEVPGRSCAICQRPISTRGQVFLAPIDACVCKACGHDLLEALEPKAEKIAVSTKPAAKPKRVVRKADTPFDEESFKRNMKWEFLRLMIEYAAKHR